MANNKQFELWKSKVIRKNATQAIIYYLSNNSQIIYSCIGKYGAGIGGKINIIQSAMITLLISYTDPKNRRDLIILKLLKRNHICIAYLAVLINKIIKRLQMSHLEKKWP